TYHGKVVSIKEFGAFVEVFPGKDGLVHISELADFRVKRTEDVANIGEMIWVKCIGIDDKGRVKLSRRAALKEQGEGGAGGGEGGGEGQPSQQGDREHQQPMHR
ncbi:MAG: S1 RNA-binding domain-containing protein, partial [Chthoniobacterales bacterium]